MQDALKMILFTLIVIMITKCIDNAYAVKRYSQIFDYPKSIEEIIKNVATSEEVNPKLLGAICYTESHNNPLALNKHDGHSDSIGFCQLKYSTAWMMGFRGKAKDLFNVETNLTYAAKYLHYQTERYNGDITKVIRAYNVGSYDGIPNSEYHKHVQLVMNKL